jgi:hypothetical protein
LDEHELDLGTNNYIGTKIDLFGANKFSVLMDSDGNSAKDPNYTHPNIVRTDDGLVYNRPPGAGTFNKVNYYVF